MKIKLTKNKKVLAQATSSRGDRSKILNSKIPNRMVKYLSMLKRTRCSQPWGKLDALPTCVQYDRITLKCGSAVNIFNLSDKIQEIRMTANKVYGKQLYRQGVRG